MEKASLITGNDGGWWKIVDGSAILQEKVMDAMKQNPEQIIRETKFPLDVERN